MVHKICFSGTRPNPLRGGTQKKFFGDSANPACYTHGSPGVVHKISLSRDTTGPAYYPHGREVVVAEWVGVGSKTKNRYFLRVVCCGKC